MKSKKVQKTTSSIIIFQSKDGKVHLDVSFDNETVWLTQKQMALLFDKNIRTISEHIKNIFYEGELEENRVIRNFRITAEDGKLYDTLVYNLDVIISVGYRVKSIQGTQFRIWATKVLRDHIVKGYSINQKRLLAQTEEFKKLQSAIQFLKEKIHNPEVKNQAGDVLGLLSDYASSFTILHKYDDGVLEKKGRKKATAKLVYDECVEVVQGAKRFLSKKKEAGSLFGHEYGGKFKGILGSIYQTFDGKDVYGSLEEKAAHLLYFVIKDHPFADGNKRIGSFLFVYFLEKNRYLFKKNGERKITDSTLASLALLVALSHPKEKDLMIGLITNLLK